MTRDYDELFRVPVNRARRPVSESRTSTCDLPWAPESPACLVALSTQDVQTLCLLYESLPLVVQM